MKEEEGESAGFSVARLSIIPLTSRLGLRFLLDLASVVACSLTLRFFLAFSKGYLRGFEILVLWYLLLEHTPASFSN
ncbi:IQ calmodulin-binding motif [Musa troglodytarum]|uniref:IQ calmodulin-binding motif n=1 Tax=Musa troglodytarum TaxID=320322 RepID=A0A9E7KS80_9LILI|nr:IQ calmodulin-binding motif [Musa troglodytarum]